MKLTDIFWKKYELNLQEVKISYLNWAITHAREPGARFRHLFLWDHQKDFCIVNSRYGRSFAISPFGLGVRGVPKPVYDGIPPGLDEIDLELKRKLTTNTHKIREALKVFLVEDKIEEAKKATLNYYWLKLGQHELLFDRDNLFDGGDESGLCSETARAQLDFNHSGCLRSIGSRRGKGGSGKSLNLRRQSCTKSCTKNAYFCI